MSFVFPSSVILEFERKIKCTNVYISIPKEVNIRSLLGKRTNRKLANGRRIYLTWRDTFFSFLCTYTRIYTRVWKIHRREPVRTVPITRNKCELIKGRKQLLANKSPPLIRYSADKLNFSSRRQFSCERARALARSRGALREIGICETDVDVGARSHNWLWASAPASQSRSRTTGGGAKDEMDHSIRWDCFKTPSSLQAYLALCVSIVLRN